MAQLDYFLLTATLTAIVTDYTDQDDSPDLQPISATVEFRPRIGTGKIVWVPSLTPPQGIALPGIKARFDSDGILRTIQDAAVDESQRITVTGNPFTVSFKSVPTGNLSSSATPAQVETAICALSTVGASNAAVSGPNGGPYDVVFNDALGDQDVPQMTATNATITTTRAGTLAAGVKLTAGTSVLGLGEYDPQAETGGLIYDVIWSNVVYNKLIQDINPFGFVALPEWAGTTVDLATVTKVPPLAGL